MEGSREIPARIVKAREALKQASEITDSLIGSVAKEHSTINFRKTVWDALWRTEYAIVILKLDLNVENPGQLQRIEKTADESRDLLVGASDEIHASIEELDRGEELRALQRAREGRNMLRQLTLQLRSREATP